MVGDIIAIKTMQHLVTGLLLGHRANMSCISPIHSHGKGQECALTSKRGYVDNVSTSASVLSRHVLQSKKRAINHRHLERGGLIASGL